MKELWKKLEKEMVFLKFDDVVFKLIPDSEFTIVKYKGGTEYSVKSTTDLALTASIEGEEITEEEFNNY